MTKEKEDEEDPNAISSREAMKMVNGMLDKMVGSLLYLGALARGNASQAKRLARPQLRETARLTHAVGLGVYRAGRPVRDRRRRGDGRSYVPSRPTAASLPTQRSLTLSAVVRNFRSSS